MWTIEAELILIFGLFFAFAHGFSTGLKMPS
jgi:hypothetical protein